VFGSAPKLLIAQYYGSAHVAENPGEQDFLERYANRCVVDLWVDKMRAVPGLSRVSGSNKSGVLPRRRGLLRSKYRGK
jgi:hypothetical protein